MYHDIAVPLNQLVNIFSRSSSFQDEEIFKDALHIFTKVLVIDRLSCPPDQHFQVIFIGFYLFEIMHNPQQCLVPILSTREGFQRQVVGIPFHTFNVVYASAAPQGMKEVNPDRVELRRSFNFENEPGDPLVVEPGYLFDFGDILPFQVTLGNDYSPLVTEKDSLCSHLLLFSVGYKMTGQDQTGQRHHTYVKR